MFPFFPDVHGAEFKAQVLAECGQPGASVAAIALAHGLNVNLLRKWLVVGADSILSHRADSILSQG